MDNDVVARPVIANQPQSEIQVKRERVLVVGVLVLLAGTDSTERSTYIIHNPQTDREVIHEESIHAEGTHCIADGNTTAVNLVRAASEGGRTRARIWTRTEDDTV